MTGVILKGISGFYYIEAEDGKQYVCKAKGSFRNKNVVPLAGDRVSFTVEENQSNKEIDGFIDEIKVRKNEFDRPPLANVDTMVLTMAAKDPEPSFFLMDKFIASAEKIGCKIILCLNKKELVSLDTIIDFENHYKSIYPFFAVSVKENEGIDDLRKAIINQQVAFAGPSGVGKSSLINMLLGDNKSETGDISKKSLRGKNTTRHAELFKGDGFFVFDTPGFSAFDDERITEEELPGLFSEFRAYLGKCYFNDCKHIKEPDCAIREAVNQGHISKDRYESYKVMLEEIRKNKKY